jgi:hypothetical protein
LSQPEGGFDRQQMPQELQYAPMYALTHHTEDNTSTEGTFYLGGNHYLVKPQFGRYDASKGWALNYSFSEDKIEFEEPEILGINGQIRQLEIVNLQTDKQLLIGVNNQAGKLLQLVKNQKNKE